jgi:flagellin
MSRINTNVVSLVAQRNLGISNTAVSKSLERLSTGLRINRGADDPAGLIASERLRSEKVALQTAISNNVRAVNLLGTAEGSLNEINALLLDIQALVAQAANSGGITTEEVAANQIQVDEAINSITRISDTAQFNGKLLLDGSETFTFQIGAEINATNQVTVTIDDVSADQLGTTGLLNTLLTGGANELSVTANLDTAATVVKESIDQIASLRGTIGAVQKNTLETSIRSLGTALENITSAESAVRDTDFAAETASLTRAQILSQAGTSVLAMANAAPQNVLALLGQ